MDQSVGQKVGAVFGYDNIQNYTFREETVKVNGHLSMDLFFDEVEQ